MNTGDNGDDNPPDPRSYEEDVGVWRQGCRQRCRQIYRQTWRLMYKRKVAQTKANSRVLPAKIGTGKPICFGFSSSLEKNPEGIITPSAADRGASSEKPCGPARVLMGGEGSCLC